MLYATRDAGRAKNLIVWSLFSFDSFLFFFCYSRKNKYQKRQQKKISISFHLTDNNIQEAGIHTTFLFLLLLFNCFIRKINKSISDLLSCLLLHICFPLYYTFFAFNLHIKFDLTGTPFLKKKKREHFYLLPLPTTPRLIDSLFCFNYKCKTSFWLYYINISAYVFFVWTWKNN